MGIIVAILIFGLIVLIHELGHFSLAKFNGIRVDEFSLGLGPTVVGKHFKGTKFSLKLLPFGGACMMGEDDIDDKSEGSFNSKSVWRRMSVILAGSVFNLLLALILSTIIVGMSGVITTEVGEVTEGFSAAEEGIMPGDVILRLNGRRIHMWDEISIFMMMNDAGNPVEIQVLREGERFTVTLEPRRVDGDEGRFILGLSSTERIMPGGLRTVQYGAYTVRYWVNVTFDSLRLLVTGQLAFENVSSVVGIVDAVGERFEAARPSGFRVTMLSMLGFTVLLTANLGIMNLLPLPALDGGRMIFLILEAIRGKRIAPEKEGIVHLVGLVLLLTLMVAVLFNDIARIVGRIG